MTPERLWTLLGYPAGGVPLQVTDEDTTDAGGWIETRLQLVGPSGDIPGIYLRPNGVGAFPAVLYCHAHGNNYAIGSDELLSGRPALQDPPYGRDLAVRGFAVLCIDMPGFGVRQAEGPESALSKAALWQGRTLMGQMLAELHGAFHWLAARPEIRYGRIATLGLSMGATQAYWLAALEPRIAACAHLCVLSDIAPLIETGAHDLHGPYMTVPGLLAEADMGDVAALVAPRPHYVGLGALDPLTPQAGRDAALAKLTKAYGIAPDALDVHLSPDTGHVETPEMRVEVLSFLEHHLLG